MFGSGNIADPGSVWNVWEHVDKITIFREFNHLVTSVLLGRNLTAINVRESTVEMHVIGSHVCWHQAIKQSSKQAIYYNP
jgi:hypothetical protein